MSSPAPDALNPTRQQGKNSLVESGYEAFEPKVPQTMRVVKAIRRGFPSASGKLV